MLGDKRGQQRSLTLPNTTLDINKLLLYSIHNAARTLRLSQVCNNHISTDIDMQITEVSKNLTSRDHDISLGGVDHWATYG
jgi:hypothetical protein